MIPSHRTALFLRMAELLPRIELPLTEVEVERLRADWHEIKAGVEMEVEGLRALTPEGR